MRKHGCRGTLQNSSWIDQLQDGSSRPKTQLSYESGRQTYRWSVEKRETRLIKR